MYTAQYGWVWMPYADAYTSVPRDGWGEPYMYVYHSGYGWTWIAAPWIWGYGPWPWFGVAGPSYYAWYGWGAWREPYRYRYVPSRPAYPYPGRVAAPPPVRSQGAAAAPAPFRPSAPEPFVSGSAPRAAPAPAPAPPPARAPPPRVAPSRGERLR